jgi:hypothetical protein
MSNIWRIRGDGLDPTIEYTDLAVIKEIIDAQVALKIDADASHFHVYAKYFYEDGGYIFEPCPLDSDAIPESDTYVASNMFTGSYEEFDNFIEAKQRCLEIKQIRWNQYASTYHVVQNTGVDENGIPDGSEIIVYTGATL